MAINLQNVSFKYSKKATVAQLDNVTLQINAKNEFIAILGQTGSGKSTLVQHMNGLLFANSGSVEVFDINVVRNKTVKLKPVREHVGLVFQFPEYQIFEATVLDDIMFGPKNFGKSKEVAKEFLAYLCNEKYLLDFTKKTGTLRPFKYDDSVLDASALGLNDFNASVLEVYKTSDVRLVSLPANITNPANRSLISLYKDMQLNGSIDWTSFAKLMRTKDSKTIMEDVYTTTKPEFEKWKTSLGV